MADLNDLTCIKEGLERLHDAHVKIINEDGVVNITAIWDNKFSGIVREVENDESFKWDITKQRIWVPIEEELSLAFESISTRKATIVFNRIEKDSLGIETQRLAEFIHDYLDHYDEHCDKFYGSL